MSSKLNVNVGDYVEIILLSDPRKTSTGRVSHILVDPTSNKITVLLDNGDKGRVIQIMNSEKIIEERIMYEDQYTENKANFSEKVMSTMVIPKTVQSFLNSDGGYLYIGVGDTGTLTERLIGLDYDFSHITDHKNKSNYTLCDELERKIMDALDKYLDSDTALGSLVNIRFVYVLEVQIIEIKIKSSTKPWFFRNLNKANKPLKFVISSNDTEKHERVLDDFYIRQGGSKKMLSTHREFYTYVLDHFKT